MNRTLNCAQLSELAGLLDFETSAGQQEFARRRDRCVGIETRLRTIISENTWNAIGRVIESAIMAAGLASDARGSRDPGLRREADSHREEYARRRANLVERMDDELSRLRALAKGERGNDGRLVVG